MKLVNAFLSIMFMGFAALQFNDPDPVVWILIYGAMSVVCLMAIFKYYVPKLMVVLAIVYSVYCVLLLPGVAEWLRQENKAILFDDVMKMQYPYIEESREFLGLMICLVVLAFYFVLSLRRKPHNS